MGMLCDFLWSDPDADLQGWGENDRGVSYTYGTDVVADFLAKFDFDLVVRAHQAGGVLRTSTGLTLNRRTQSAPLYGQSP